MQKRQLGADGPMVGAIGLGCMSFAGFYGPTDEATSHRTLAAARELGMTHLDTANVYGNGVSESVIGSFLKGKAHNFVIATKASISKDANGKRCFDNSAAHLRSELEASLQRLQVDHVALFYIHRREQSRPIEEVMETLLALRDEGKIGGIGFSEISPSSLRRAAKVGPVMAVQSEYSIWSRVPELGMIQACAELGTAFVPFSPVCRGMAADRSPDLSRMSDMDIRKTGPRFSGINLEYNIAAFDRLRAIAADHGVPTAGLALAWVLDSAPHLIPIPGTRTPEHLAEIATGASIDMTDSLRQEIASALPPGFAHGDRYSDAQMVGVERYC